MLVSISPSYKILVRKRSNVHFADGVAQDRYFDIGLDE